MAWTERAKKRGGDCKPSDVVNAAAVDVLHHLLESGALVSFGMARDGGSLSCTITFEGEWDRDWFREPDALVDWMADSYSAICEAVAARPPATGGNRRSSNGAPRRDR